jgi:hypothetical protein
MSTFGHCNQSINQSIHPSPSPGWSSHRPSLAWLNANYTPPDDTPPPLLDQHLRHSETYLAIISSRFMARHTKGRGSFLFGAIQCPKRVLEVGGARRIKPRWMYARLLQIQVSCSRAFQSQDAAPLRSAVFPSLDRYLGNQPAGQTRLYFVSRHFPSQWHHSMAGSTLCSPSCGQVALPSSTRPCAKQLCTDGR